MDYRTIQNKCESTPFICISLKGHCRIELYWSKSRGVEGFQVYGVLIRYCEEPVFMCSHGCGYSKDDYIFEHLLRKAGVMPRGQSLGGATVPYTYHKGGNYYEVPKKDVLKIKPRKKAVK
tara:strand:- start:156 stop:515 length:360 start_codon:yes stop_codon:yes gene_type:complete